MSAMTFPFLALWHSVPERAFYGTEYAFGAQKGFLGYATHFQRPSVLKTGFWGTEGIFGTGNALLRYGTRFQRRKTADSDTRLLNYPVRPYPSAPPHLKYGLNY